VLDNRPRLVDDPPGAGGKGQAEVNVLAVHGRELGVEAADREECGAPDQEARGRRVVDSPSEVVLGAVGDVAVPVLPDSRIAPDDRTGLLEPSIRVEQLGSDGGDTRISIRDVDERLEPAGLTRRRY